MTVTLIHRTCSLCFDILKKPYTDVPGGILHDLMDPWLLDRKMVWIVMFAVYSICACSNSSATIVLVIPINNWAQPLDNWKSLRVDEPWNIFVMNDALVTRVDGVAYFCSFEILQIILLNTPLFSSTLPFFQDSREGLGFKMVTWVWINLLKNPLQNSWSSPNAFSGPWWKNALILHQNHHRFTGMILCYGPLTLSVSVVYNINHSVTFIPYQYGNKICLNFVIKSCIHVGELYLPSWYWCAFRCTNLAGLVALTTILAYTISQFTCIR